MKQQINYVAEAIPELGIHLEQCWGQRRLGHHLALDQLENPNWEREDD